MNLPFKWSLFMLIILVKMYFEKKTTVMILDFKIPNLKSLHFNADFPTFHTAFLSSLTKCMHINIVMCVAINRILIGRC